MTALSATDLVPKWRPSSLKKMNSRITILTKILETYKLDINDPSTYQLLTIPQISKMIDNDWSHNTRKNYVDLLTMLFKHFDGDITVYQYLLGLRRSMSARIVTSVQPLDSNYLDDIRQAHTDDRNMIMMRLLTDSPLAGIRVDDLIHTRFDDDGVHSWIDLANEIWYIRAEYTKNGRDRCFPIPSGVVSDLKIHRLGDWLLSNKHLAPYKNSQFILKKFRDTFHINYGIIRKTVAQLASDSNDMQVSKAHANVLGHALETEVEKYTKPIIYITKDGKIKVNVRKRPPKIKVKVVKRDKPVKIKVKVAKRGLLF